MTSICYIIFFVTAALGDVVPPVAAPHSEAKIEAVPAAPPVLPEVPAAPPVLPEGPAAPPVLPEADAVKVVVPATHAAATSDSSIPGNAAAEAPRPSEPLPSDAHARAMAGVANDEAVAEAVAQAAISFDVEEEATAKAQNHLDMMVPALAALVSFAGILAYSCVFISKIFRPRAKGESHGGAAKTAPKKLDDFGLDFEDLEDALGMTPSTTASTPMVRKMVHSQCEELSFNNRDSDLMSDAGWGDDGWGNDGWESEADCDITHDASGFDCVGAMGMVQAAPLVKGKAD